MHFDIDQFITHYGGFAIFFLLALGIVGLPIPDETILIFSGVLIARGNLQLIPTYLAAFSGSIFGITVSYMIGRTLGYKIAHRFGKYIGITVEKLKKVHNWFERFGKWTLPAGYFLPAVRHFTGLVAGIAQLEYWIFAIFAYTGAFFWSILFISIGYFFFNEYKHIHL